MEQSANRIVRLRSNTGTIQAVTKDTSFQAYIRLLTAAAPSDSVFRALGTNRLTYLLTYLKLEVCSYNRFRDIRGSQNLRSRLRDLRTAPF